MKTWNQVSNRSSHIPNKIKCFLQFAIIIINRYHRIWKMNVLLISLKENYFCFVSNTRMILTSSFFVYKFLIGISTSSRHVLRCMHKQCFWNLQTDASHYKRVAVLSYFQLFLKVLTLLGFDNKGEHFMYQIETIRAGVKKTSHCPSMLLPIQHPCNVTGRRTRY